VVGGATTAGGEDCTEKFDTMEWYDAARWVGPSIVGVNPAGRGIPDHLGSSRGSSCEHVAGAEKRFTRGGLVCTIDLE
jgi:hypothetical protein